MMVMMMVVVMVVMEIGSRKNTEIAVVMMMVVMEIGSRKNTEIAVVMMMVVMMVMVEILRQLHGLLLGRRGGHMSIVRFEDIERIWDRFQKIAIAGGGGELNRRRGRGLRGLHGG
jgi:hypothetical protein